MLPERALLHVADEPNGLKVKIPLPLLRHDVRLDHVARLGRAPDGALERHRLGVGDGPRQLRGAEDVGEEGVVVEAPDAVGACGLEGVCEYETADDLEVADRCVSPTCSFWENNVRVCVCVRCGWTYGSRTPRTMCLSISPPAFPSVKAPSFQRHPRNARKLSSWPVP